MEDKNIKKNKINQKTSNIESSNNTFKTLISNMNNNKSFHISENKEKIEIDQKIFENFVKSIYEQIVNDKYIEKEFDETKDYYLLTKEELLRLINEVYKEMSNNTNFLTNIELLNKNIFNLKTDFSFTLKVFHKIQKYNKLLNIYLLFELNIEMVKINGNCLVSFNKIVIEYQNNETSEALYKLKLFTSDISSKNNNTMIIKQKKEDSNNKNKSLSNNDQSSFEESISKDVTNYDNCASISTVEEKFEILLINSELGKKSLIFCGCNNEGCTRCDSYKKNKERKGPFDEVLSYIKDQLKMEKNEEIHYTPLWFGKTNSYDNNSGYRCSFCKDFYQKRLNITKLYCNNRPEFQKNYEIDKDHLCNFYICKECYERKKRKGEEICPNCKRYYVNFGRLKSTYLLYKTLRNK